MNVLLIADAEEARRVRFFLEDETREKLSVRCFTEENCSDAGKLFLDNPYLYNILFIGRIITDQSSDSDAEEIRRMYSLNPRILITMSVSKTFLPYEFCNIPSIFIMKCPVSQEMIRTMLQQAAVIEKIRYGDLVSRIPVFGSEGVMMIPTASVRYARKVRSGIMMVTECGEILNRRKMDEFEKYAGKMFLRCHGSYIVNLSHILKIRKNELEMDEGEIIPVSRSYQNKVRRYFDVYHPFLFNGQRDR